MGTVIELTVFRFLISIMALSDEQNLECPLCMEPFEMDDLNFFPCTCGYQICRFCWHRIRTDENGLCPACRKQYPEDPADFKPLSPEELQKIKNEKKQKDHQRKQKMSECRKHLANVRVVQKNLVFVVGLPARLADSDVLKKHDYFGKFGKIHKVVVNQSTSYAGSQGPSASAYVTYCRSDDALRAIKTVNNIHVDGRTLKASLGTTKYCSHFLKSQQCPKTDCMYLHELGDEAASFTKEDMQQGKHQEYEKRLQDQILGCNSRKQSSSPTLQNSSKELWPCTAANGKEHRLSKSKDNSQSYKSDKPSRSKVKHNSNESQKSKKAKSRSDLSGNSIVNVSKTNKEENVMSRKNQRQSRHAKSSSQVSLHRLEEIPKRSSNKKVPDVSEMNMKNSQTTYVEITENPIQSHQSASIKITRCGSPSLPPSPASSSSSLFTPFGSLSSNFLSSSSPSPPPCSSQSYQIVGNSSNVQELNPASIYSTADREHRTSCQYLGSIENGDSLFSHLDNLPLSNMRYYADQQNEEDQILMNDEDRKWNTSYPFDSSQKHPEDDLDFDPWNESSKGLADLMASEASTESYRSVNMPPGFVSFKTVPNNSKLSVPPPGFNNQQQILVTDTSNSMQSYGINPAYNNRIFNEKRQNFMDAMPRTFSHSSQVDSTSHCKEFSHYPSCDMNFRLKEFLRMKDQIQCQESFDGNFSEIAYSSQNFQKNHMDSGSMWNSVEFSWLNNDNIFHSGIPEGQKSNAQFMMKALQQLKIEDSLNVSNGRTSYSSPYTLRGHTHWPQTSQCPPPGFVASSRSPDRTIFPNLPLNNKI